MANGLDQIQYLVLNSVRNSNNTLICQSDMNGIILTTVKPSTIPKECQFGFSEILYSIVGFKVFEKNPK